MAQKLGLDCSALKGHKFWKASFVVLAGSSFVALQMLVWKSGAVVVTGPILPSRALWKKDILPMPKRTLVFNDK
jgi:hypothetical protein